MEFCFGNYFFDNTNVTDEITMEKSAYTQEKPCSCGCNETGNEQNETIRTNCGCGGLGEAPAKDAPETQKDIISEAKKFVNGEIPAAVKCAAGLGVIAILLLVTRGRQ